MKYTIATGQVTVSFDQKPPAEALAILKAHGFRWNRNSRSWWRRKVTGAADIIGDIQKRIEPKRPDGSCWGCGSPEGYFRARGAATPGPPTLVAPAPTLATRQLGQRGRRSSTSARRGAAASFAERVGSSRGQSIPISGSFHAMAISSEAS